MRLPTATLKDVLSWRRCYWWDAREEVEALWERLGNPEQLNALEILRSWRKFPVRGGGRLRGSAVAKIDVRREDAVWAACHLLPDEPSFREKLDRHYVFPYCGHSVWHVFGGVENGVGTLCRLLSNWEKKHS